MKNQKNNIKLTDLTMVALICYISHSAQHRKMADFDPLGSENP